MNPAVSRLEAALAATEIRIPRIPVISNVDAQPHADPETIKKVLARQVNTKLLVDSHHYQVVALFIHLSTGIIGNFPRSMGDNCKDSPNQRFEEELRVGTWKGKSSVQLILFNIWVIFLRQHISRKCIVNDVGSSIFSPVLANFRL